MNNVLNTIETILCAETDDLKELADLVGVHPTIMYLGADLTGTDLTGQDIKFLVGLNADYSKACLTDEQREYLLKRDNHDNSTKNRRIRSAIAAMRVRRIQRFLEDIPKTGDREKLLEETLLKPFRGSLTIAELQKVEGQYFTNALISLTENKVADSHVRNFFQVVRDIRIPANSETYVFLARYQPEVLRTQSFKENFDLDLMRDDFLHLWISNDVTQAQKHHQSFERAMVVVAGKKRLSADLIVGLVRACNSLNNVRELLSHIRNQKFPSVNSVIADKIAEMMISEEDIRTVMMMNVSQTLKRHVLLAASKTGNPDLAAAAIRSSVVNDIAIGGLALSDAIHACKSFSTAMKLAKKISRGLITYERMVVIDALGSKARNQEERRLVTNFSYQKHIGSDSKQA